MYRLGRIITGLGLIVAIGVGPLAADTGQDLFGQASRQGLEGARSAVPAPHTMAYAPDLFGRGRSHVPVAFGRSEAVLPDFSAYQDVQAKKMRFFGYLLPLVEQENERLLGIRTRLNYIYDHQRWGRAIDSEDRSWLDEVVQEFGIPQGDPNSADFWQVALQRVDAIPENLVLVQAANESAWGTSRFAREGNNLFGQWCFREGCGLVPESRPQDATYEVARFDSVSESIGSYMHNLNTGRTYQLLREIRARMRAEGKEPDPAALAAGLTDYSERGLEYVDELRVMIRHNEEVIAEVRTRNTSDGNS